MKRIDHETLLWMLAELSEQHDQVAPADMDMVLEQYLNGALRGEERRQLEALLGRSPQARQRLVELAGEEPVGPPRGMRERVLAHAPRPVRRRRWLPIACGLAAALLLAVVLVQLQAPQLPADVRYQIAASGLADSRGGTAAEPRVTAFPETRVTIDAVPGDGARVGIDLGLYAEQDGRLERLDGRDGVQRSVHRGRISFTAPAATLVGNDPGTYTVYVVVALADDLPESFRLEAGQDPSTVASSGDRRRVYQQPITVLAHQQGSSDV